MAGFAKFPTASVKTIRAQGFPDRAPEGGRPVLTVAARTISAAALFS
jgi:hypothetical protein